MDVDTGGTGGPLFMLIYLRPGPGKDPGDNSDHLDYRPGVVHNEDDIFSAYLILGEMLH